MQMICEPMHVTVAFQCTEPTAEGRKKGDKMGTSERQWSELRSIGSDIRGCVSERQPKKYIKQHISHPQVETGRWSSQCQAAWCQLIWRDAAAVRAGSAKRHTADLEAVWNSTMRNKIEIWGKKEQWRSVFLKPAILFYSSFHSVPGVSTLYWEIRFHI